MLGCETLKFDAFLSTADFNFFFSTVKVANLILDSRPVIHMTGDLRLNAPYKCAEKANLFSE